MTQTTDNDFDYRKPRIQTDKIIPEYFRTDITTSVLNSGINRLLTPEDSVYVNGSVGKKNPQFKSDNRIVESSIDRTAWQLQPLLYTKIATAEYMYSHSDILNILEHIGVDINRFNKWGKTEAFNFAPPINIDKIINYGDYYWVDSSPPQYVTIKNTITILKSQIIEQTRLYTDTEAAGVLPGKTADNLAATLAAIQSVLDTLNTKLTSTSPTGWSDTLWDDTNGDWDTDQLWKTLIPHLQIQPVGDNTWDIETGLIMNDWSIQNKWVHKTDLNNIGIVTRATMPIIEYNSALELNEWVYTKHNWKYRKDIASPWTIVDVEPSILEIIAQFHIRGIEYDTLSTNPKNKKVFVVYNNVVGSLPIGLQFSVEYTLCNDGVWTVDAVEYNSIQNVTLIYTTDDIKYLAVANEFYDSDGDAEDSTIDPDGDNNLFGFDSPPPPNLLPQSCPIDVLNNGIPLADTHGIITPYVTSLGDLWQGLYGHWKWNGVNDPVPVPNQVINVAQQSYVTTIKKPQNSFELPFYYYANIDNLYVYVDGIRQYGTYVEVQISGEPTANIIRFKKALPIGTHLQVKTGPCSVGDIGREMVWVRTTEQDSNNTASIVSFICLIRYRKHEQVKSTTTQYPLFNIYHASGEPAYIANSIFTFQELDTAPIDVRVNRRIEIITNTTGIDYVFNQMLTNPTTGELYCYRDLDLAKLPDMLSLQTVWKSGILDYTYAPRYVNKYQLADGDNYIDSNGAPATASVPVGSADGMWEVPNQLYYNPLHECRTVVNFSQLFTHFQTIVNKQPKLPGYEFVSHNGNFKLLEYIDYGLGGTIHEYNGGYGNFLSSLYQDIITPTGVISFAVEQYANCLNILQNLYVINIATTLLKNDDATILHPNAAAVNTIIQLYQQHDNLTQLFGDSSSYNTSTGQGIKNWVATLPMLGIIPPQRPVALIDGKINVNKIIHHDGHISDVLLNTVDTDTIIATILQNNSTSGVGALPSINNLHFGHFWYDTHTTKLYRYSVIAISNQYPVSTAPVGAYWYNTADHNLYVKQSNNSTDWVIELDHTKAWTQIDIIQIYTDLILSVETKLYDISITYPSNTIDMAGIIVDKADAVLYYDTLHTDYMAYVKLYNLDVSNYDYTISNPYTWNYRDLPLTNLLTPSVLAVVANKWGARWDVIYQNLFNTRYPHLEPWKLQGYTSEPTWWSNTYVDTTGARKWQPVMWVNIKAGIIPTNMELPNNIVPTYSFMCVNTLPDTISGYAPDSLLPPYYSGDVRLETQTIIRGTISNIQIANITNSISKPYVFGDQGPTEQIWRDSVRYNYDILNTNFTMQPMSVFNRIFGYEYYTVNKLQIEKTSMSVIPHTKTFFHGDIVNNNIVKVHGINQWYVNAIRYSVYDAHSSDFKPLWTTWEPNLTYQFDSAINTNTLVVNSDFYPITPFDYTIYLKKSPAVDEYWASELLVTLQQVGTVVSGSKALKTPYGDGSDWTYRVDIPIDVGFPFKFFDVNDYQIIAINDLTNEITLNRPTPWITGTQIQITSNINAIRNNYPYFAIMISSTVLKLADAYVDAIVKINNTNVYDTINVFKQLTVDTIPQSGDLWVNNGVLEQYNASVGRWIGNSSNRILFQLNPGVLGSDLRIYDHGVRLHVDQGYTIINDWVELLLDITTADLKIHVMLQYNDVYELYTTFQALDGAHTPQVWKHYTVNTDRVLTLPAPLLITGIQNVVNFVDGYAEYLKSIGFITNYMSNSVDIDPVTGLIINWQSELEKLIDKMYRGFNNTYNSTSPAVTTVYDYYEVNPFKYNLWLRPTRGIVSNIITGPFNDIRTQPVVFNQNGTPIQAIDNLKIYRLDKVTHFSYPNNAASKYYIGGVHLFTDTYENIIMFNNYTVDGYLVYDPFVGLNVSKINLEFKKHYEPSGRPHLGGHFLQDNQLVENIELMTQNHRDMYNTYTVNEHANHIDYSRALLGYNANEASYLDVMNISAKSKFIFYRGMIQYKGTNHAVNAFTNSVDFESISVDEFWAYKVAAYGDNRVKSKPQLIIQDTDVSRDTIKYHFTSDTDAIQPLFIEVSNTDISRWVNLPNIPELQNTNMYFTSGITKLQNITTNQYNGVTYTDLGSICDAITITFKNNNTFNQTVVLHPGEDLITLTEFYHRSTDSVIVYVDGVQYPRITEILDNVIQLTHLPYGTHNVSVMFKDGNLYESLHYVRLNSHIVKWNIDISTLQGLELYQHLPNNNIMSGMKLIDTQTNIAISDLSLWHPAISIHDTRVDAIVDYTLPHDPAQYQIDHNDTIDVTLTNWGDREVNQVWVDNSNIEYIPYYDTNIFTDINSRLFYWGKLAIWSTVDVYEWTASNIIPNSWDDLVKQQQGSTLIDEIDKATGTPYVVNLISYRSSPTSEWSTWVENVDAHITVPCYQYIQTTGVLNIDLTTPNISTATKTQLLINDTTNVYDVYVNELKLQPNEYNATIVNDIITNITVLTVKPQDTVRILSYAYKPDASSIDALNALPTALVQYRIFYPYNKVESVDPSGQNISYTFYYWVKHKTNKTKGNNLSIADVTQIYMKPQSMYAILQNQLPQTKTLPARYTQFIMQGAGLIVTEGERYTIMFVQDQTLRDGLYNDVPMLKNIHHEWRLLRSNQPEALPRYLWDKITETMIGSLIDDTSYPIPSLTRVLYDSVNFTTTQYGLMNDQALGDKRIILQTILDTITDVQFDPTPINKETFMETYTFDSNQNIIASMDYIYTNFNSVNVNNLFFRVLNDALSVTDELDGIFKTSMISVHSVSKLITAKDVVG